MSVLATALEQNPPFFLSVYNLSSPSSFFVKLLSKESKPCILFACAVQVVALSRLVYRKGIDLMALVIPYICSMYPNVDFVIGEYIVEAVHR